MRLDAKDLTMILEALLFTFPGESTDIRVHIAKQLKFAQQVEIDEAEFCASYPKGDGLCTLCACSVEGCREFI